MNLPFGTKPQKFFPGAPVAEADVKFKHSYLGKTERRYVYTVVIVNRGAETSDHVKTHGFDFHVATDSANEAQVEQMALAIAQGAGLIPKMTDGLIITGHLTEIK